MIDCVAIGDEIAARMSLLLPCAPMTEVGRTPFGEAALMRDVRADRVLISLGTYPAHYRDPNLAADMRYVRSRVEARQVVWILPLQPEAREAVRRLAAQYKDVVVEVPRAF
jgi:hypothetical protein